MPIYEYRCEACQKVTSILVRSVNNPPPPHCRFCRSDRLTRLISRVVTPKSEERRLESLADPSALGDLDENDPQSMNRWMKKMAGEMGEDFDEEALGEMESTGDEPSGENTESAV